MGLKKRMKVLIIGSGGREHALAWKLAQSAQVEALFVASGNAGTIDMATNVPISVTDLPALAQFALDNEIGLTVVGPEVPLAMGLTDYFQARGLVVFGPSQAAAQLEASKAFSKDFMQAEGIPTAVYATFTDHASASAFLQENGERAWVVKASGLAAGKGVIVCDTVAEAQFALDEIMGDKRFGEAGETVIIEERLTGPEVSLLALCDGETAVPLLPARDHKRAYDGDAGPNTGGMGAYAPPADVDSALVEEIMERVIQPTLVGMAKRGTPYVGVLYAGLMLTPDGMKVLEFNCRFGDPETQVVLPMLESDLATIMLACTRGELTADLVKMRDGACATVVLASPGYPNSYPKGLPITGIELANGVENVVVFHAGTKQTEAGVVTSGGRVLAVSAWGADLETAVAQAYAGIEQINFDKAHYRRDIGR